MRLTILTHRRWGGLVEVGEIVRRNIDELVAGIVALAGNVKSPAGNGLAVASGPGTSDDNGDVKH
jgi:hypothetical protein